MGTMDIVVDNISDSSLNSLLYLRVHVALAIKLLKIDSSIEKVGQVLANIFFKTISSPWSFWSFPKLLNSSMKM